MNVLKHPATYTPHPAPTLAGGSEPPHDGGMEARVAKLEAGMEHVVRDLADVKADLRAFRTETSANFRWLLGAMSAAFIILLGAIAHGFHWL